jgi:hypothetical protein
MPIGANLALSASLAMLTTTPIAPVDQRDAPAPALGPRVTALASATVEIIRFEPAVPRARSDAPQRQLSDNGRTIEFY